MRINWVVFDLAIVLFYFYYFYTYPLNFGIAIRERKILFFLLSLLTVFFIISLVNQFELAMVQFLKHYYYVRPILFIQILVVAQKKYRRYFEGFLKKVFWFSIFFFVFNVPFILKQFQQGFYVDDINGLFGDTTNPVLALSFLFVLTLLRFYKRLNLFFLGIVSVITLFLSILASIRVFIVLLLMIWVYFLYEKGFFSFKTIVTTIFTLMGSIFIFSLLLSYNSFVGKHTEYLINLYIENYLHNDAEGGEREYMVSKAFSSSDIFWGEGIGSISEVFGFEGALVDYYPKHININDVGTLLIEGGIFYYIILTFGIALSLTNLFPFQGRKRFGVFIVLLMLINFLFFYTRFVTDPRRMVLGIMIFVVIGEYFKKKELSSQNSPLQLHSIS